MQSPLDFSLLTANKNDHRMIIYHGSCPDGFGAAFSAWYYYKTNGFNMEEFTFLPAYYNGNLPDVTGQSVLVCDFSFSYEKTIELINNANNLTILDHHATAEKNLAQIPSTVKYFNMNHSGAYITWVYFFGEDNVPDLIKYIEDRDLWNKKLPNTDEISIYLSTLPYEFEVFEKYLSNRILKAIIPEAIGMVSINNKYIKNAIKRGEERLIKLPDDKIYRVVFCNSTELQSDIGNRILFEFPLANFSAIYNVYNNIYNFSLRSMNDRTDVGTLANTHFNGGGHRNASGCSGKNSNDLPSTETIGRASLCKILSNYEMEEFSYDMIKTYVMKFNFNNINDDNNLIKNDIMKYLMQTRFNGLKEWQHLCQIELKNIIIMFYKNDETKTNFYLGFTDKKIQNQLNEYFSDVSENFNKFFIKPTYTTLELPAIVNSLEYIKNFFI